MRLVSLVALLSALAGCSFSPPKPPECEGEFRPINIQQKGASAMNAKDSLALCSKGGSYVHG
jgi:hypothetical protein